jgi:hypothetical protein
VPTIINSKSAEQTFDAEPNGKYLYRPGELVWFNKGQAWGLSVISKRQTINGQPRYLVQPLSHPLQHSPYQIKDREVDIRPWLAWSVPTPTHSAITNKITYDQVPWDRVIRGDFGPGDAEVDGSILAAKNIDSSYSLFDRVETPQAAPGEIYFNGMFLGAEKIWVGEPIRIRAANDDILVLVIQSLIEVPPSTTAGSYVVFVGDVYKFLAAGNPYQNRSQWPNHSHLPPRMAADLRFRNEVAENAKKGIWYDWLLIERSSKKGLADIKGRWYETRTLLPILRGKEQFEIEIHAGLTTDAGLWMNGRGDSSSMTGFRRKNRRDTLGKAVPADFEVSRGLDGPPMDDIFPDAPFPQESQRNPTPVQPKYLDTDIDQFMNLDQAVTTHDFYGAGVQ